QRFPDDLARLYVRGSGASAVPLGALVHIAGSTTSLSVNHQGQFPSVTLSFNLAPGASLSTAVQAIPRARQSIGVPASVGSSFTGPAQVFQQSLHTMPLLLLAALVAAYIVLGVLYESYIHPITIISTLPSAGMGALLALLLLRTD